MKIALILKEVFFNAVDIDGWYGDDDNDDDYEEEEEEEMEEEEEEEEDPALLDNPQIIRPWTLLNDIQFRLF